MYPCIAIFQSFVVIPFFIVFRTTDYINIYTKKPSKMFLISLKHIIDDKTNINISTSTC